MEQGEVKPFSVFWDETGDSYYIFAPDGCILVGGKPAEIKGADSQSNVRLDFASLPEALWAHVTKKSGSSSGDEYEVEFDGQATKSGAKWNFRVANFGVAENDGEQYDLATGVVNLGGGAEADEKSIAKIPPAEEGEDPVDDEGKLQIKDFSSNDSDSPEGLAERLSADTKTGEVKLKSGTNIMLVARRNGKIVYIPLSAPGEDEEDEKPDDPEKPDPCVHPGDPSNDGGVSPYSSSSEGGGADGSGGIGGVSAGSGDVHPGDDNCNCPS